MRKSILKLALMPLTLTALSTGTAQANHAQYDMQVDGLTCPFCVATSSKALKKIDGVYDVAVDLDTGIISVCAARDTDLSDKRMKKLFRKKGFTYRSQTVSANCNFMDVSHSETGENLIGVKAEEKEPHKDDHKSHGSGTTYGSSHDGDHDHKDHDSYGS